MKDSSLVIKSADNGGAVVVLDYEKYKEIQRQLSNEHFYRKVSVDPHRCSKGIYALIWSKPY
jgi:hypothetical protein